MFISELFEGKSQVPSNPKQKQGPAGQARGTDKAPFRNKLVGESAEGLNIGDPVIITGNVEFRGATGDIVDFGSGNRFVVVNLYNHGKHSFHSSDVSYNEYADSDEEEARMYDNGDFRDDFDEAEERVPQQAEPNFQKPMFEFNSATIFHPGMLAYHNLLGKVKIVSENGDELVVVDRTGKRARVERSSLLTKDEAGVNEDNNQQDEITMDVPLLIRLLEYAREDAKTDMDLHNVAEQLIKLSGQGCLSMQQYEQIVGGLDESQYDSGDYGNDRHNDDYGRGLTTNGGEFSTEYDPAGKIAAPVYHYEPTGKRGRPRLRPDAPVGGPRGRPPGPAQPARASLPPDAFGRTTGMIPKGKTGRMHRIQDDEMYAGRRDVPGMTT